MLGAHLISYQGVDELPLGCPLAGQTSVPLISKCGVDELPRGCPRAGHISVPRISYHGVDELPFGCPRAGQISVPRISKCGVEELPFGCPLAGQSSVPMFLPPTFLSCPTWLFSGRGFLRSAARALLGCRDWNEPPQYLSLSHFVT